MGNGILHGENRFPRPSIWNGLPFRIFWISALAGFMVGVVVSAVQLKFEIQHEREIRSLNADRLLKSISALAADAAYKLDETLAFHIISGMSGSPEVYHVEIETDLGDLLAHRTFGTAPGSPTALAKFLFGSHKKYQMDLRVPHRVKSVGTISMYVNGNLMAESFLPTVSRHALNTIATSILVSVLIGVLFYFSVVRSMVFATYELGGDRKDSNRTAQVTIPNFHKKNELGILLKSINSLITSLDDQYAELAFQKAALDEHSIVSISDADCKINYLNQKFVDISGFSKEELLGCAWDELISDEYSKEFFDEIWRTISNGKIWAGQLKNRKKNGEFFWVQATIIPYVNSNGTPEKYITIRTDITEQKNAVAQTRQFKSSLDLVSDEIYVFWPDTLKLFYVNKAGLEHIGIPEDETYNLTLANTTIMQDEDSIREFIQPLIDRSETEVILASRRSLENGTVAYMETWLEFVEPEGEKPRIVATLTNITERKIAEREIMKFKTSLDLTQDEVYMFWPETLNIFYVNQAAREHLGYSEKELLSMGPLDIKPEFDELQLREIISPLLDGSLKSVVFETVHQNKNGTQNPVEVTYQFIKANDEAPHFVAVVRDITKSKAADLQILQYKTTLDRMNDPVYMFWPDSLKFFYVNQAAMTAAGKTAEQFAEMTPVDLNSNMDVAAYRDRYKPLVQGDVKALTYEHEDINSQGEMVPFEILLQLIEPAGDAPRFVAIARDISERKEIEKAKTEFVSIVSHELRTPLTSIKGALGLVNAGVVGQIPEKAKDLLNIAYNNCDRLAKLINDILDIEKSDAGMMEFKIVPVDLALIVDEAIKANMGYAEEYGVQFVVSGTGGHIVVGGDSDRLMQVMANLLSNAAKFSKKGGQIEVSLTRRNNWARVSIKDFGIGIPNQAQAGIFDKFTQVDSSAQREKGGTGLGLSIARSIIEGHDGKIGFDSKINSGSTFYFDLKERPAEKNYPELIELGSTSDTRAQDYHIS